MLINMLYYYKTLIESLGTLLLLQYLGDKKGSFTLPPMTLNSFSWVKAIHFFNRIQNTEAEAK